jgi:hypothetical protein
MLAILIMLLGFQAKAFEVDTFLAPDYAVVDDIQSIKAIDEKMDGVDKGHLIFEVTGDMLMRECDYDKAMIAVQPKTPARIQDEQYLVVAYPQNSGNILRLSPVTSCSSTWMTPRPFTMKFKVQLEGFHPSWTSKEWLYEFNGDYGRVVKTLKVTFTPTKGFRFTVY